MADTKALFIQRFDAARTAWAHGDEPGAAESLHWAIAAARSDPSLRLELASALFDLGRLSRKFGRTGETEAAPLLAEALAISEELFGSEDATLAPVLHELSRLHLQQSQHARAEEALERLLAIARVKGEEHPDVADVLSDLAFVKRKLGDDASAEALYRDALRIREKVLEPNHTVTVGTLERLSETCAARGNFADALALLRRALPAREAALGADHERVRAARSRVAKLELQLATAGGTAATMAAATAEPTPSPAWIKRVPDSPGDTPSTPAPSPLHSKDLPLLGESEPRALRPAARPREWAKTPTVAAAVAAASLMASSIPTHSVSQIANSPAESVTGRGSSEARRDVVLADVVHRDVASGDAAGANVALSDGQSAVAMLSADSPEPARKKRTVMYASAGAGALAIALAALLMARPRPASGRNPAATETSGARRTTAAGALLVTAPAMKVASVGTGAAAVVATAHPDSLRVASATPAAPAAAIQREQRAPETTRSELRAPRVDVHVDSDNIPTAPTGPSFDAILRSATERQRASDTDRAEARNEVSRPTSADGENAHSSPKITGRAPEPAFPDALLRAGRREGQVVVRFMVNELGKVDLTSIIVEHSDHELFTDAVRDVLPRFRFEPAYTLGTVPRPVAAWVSLPFRFTTKKR
jgi:TonB family protein